MQCSINMIHSTIRRTQIFASFSIIRLIWKNIQIGYLNCYIRIPNKLLYKKIFYNTRVRSQIVLSCFVLPTLSATKKRAARAPFLWRRECIIRNNFFPCTYFILYLNFPHRCFYQAHQVCFANLRTLLSCAHLYGWALPVPPCERIFSTIYFGIVARHDTVVLRSFPRISTKIPLSRAHKFKQYHLFFLTLLLQNLYGKN